ncbi:MAG: transglutaminase domain-containing protein [Phycisphaerae bacterium]|nr:transglutaminase domain-containing protein [Phycisphaerae bacterium]NIP54853.1 transglutaminase domain-containing protein [Phycisphaerae bacterium]NIS52161.1 transglutaminase domain-containing protein [Phycisphaerae bacterium]NIU11142.1 transglutaminase domain-containing protein [Phycisphaerae bacterium]NIU56247.1 transglutaminase domain-containing protein [Phycisphaerae bacterium]
MRSRYLTICFVVICALVGASVGGCKQKESGRQDTSQGVVIKQPDKENLPNELTSPSFSSRAMKSPGIAGVMGGTHVKALKSGTYEVLLPIPQLADSQVPIYYYISTTPEKTLLEYRLQRRDDSNVVVYVKLKGTQNEEIQIDWSSFILITDKTITENQADPAEYLAATSCVQSEDKQITELAAKLWPGSGKTNDYAKNIQDFIRNMKQKEQPRTMDALGILKTGGNWICTANANLASALLRAKDIPCRSIAVIPPISHRLEMHRIVEYCDNGNWAPFDPSLLQADIPLKPWQNIIVTKTTIADENKAMKPRMSVSLGCPYGQEFEISKAGITVWGNDFFWTIGKPIAEFEVSDEAVKLTVEEWNRYLKGGVLSRTQIKAASAKNLEQYIKAFQTAAK